MGGMTLIKSDETLLYNVTDFIFSKGTPADKLRLISAGYEIPKQNIAQVLEELKTLLNRDGGLPFDLVKGNPSSVKITAEVLPLILKFRKEHSNFVSGMMSFLVDRQKQDGGFAETLNLDPLIEDKYGMTTGRIWYPVGKSITWLTGKALEALALSKYDDEERIRRARDFLLYAQHEDGNWPDFKGQGESDPLGTGNILPALLAAGVDDSHRVYQDGRAAMLQHLVKSVEHSSTYDMVDLISVGAPKTEKEREVVKRGLDLIRSTQLSDGGWAPIGSKKSDAELSSILAFVYKKCSEY